MSRTPFRAIRCPARTGPSPLCPARTGRLGGRRERPRAGGALLPPLQAVSPSPRPLAAGPFWLWRRGGRWAWAVGGRWACVCVRVCSWEYGGGVWRCVWCVRGDMGCVWRCVGVCMRGPELCPGSSGLCPQVRREAPEPARGPAARSRQDAAAAAPAAHPAVRRQPAVVSAGLPSSSAGLGRPCVYGPWDPRVRGLGPPCVGPGTPLCGAWDAPECRTLDAPECADPGRPCVRCVVCPRMVLFGYMCCRCFLVYGLVCFVKIYFY